MIGPETRTSVLAPQAHRSVSATITPWSGEAHRSLAAQWKTAAAAALAAMAFTLPAVSRAAGAAAANDTTAPRIELGPLSGTVVRQARSCTRRFVFRRLQRFGPCVLHRQLADIGRVDTSQVGRQALTVRAVDRAGNVATATTQWAVMPALTPGSSTTGRRPCSRSWRRCETSCPDAGRVSTSTRRSRASAGRVALNAGHRHATSRRPRPATTACRPYGSSCCACTTRASRLREHPAPPRLGGTAAGDGGPGRRHRAGQVRRSHRRLAPLLVGVARVRPDSPALVATATSRPRSWMTTASHERSPTSASGTG